jgi:hypothetical protein
MSYLNSPTPGVNRRDQPNSADTALLTKLNAAVKAANSAEATVTTAQAELVSRSKEVGRLLLEAKKLHPAVKDFEAFLKRVDGLKLSRAYDSMRIAGGRTTDEELRKEARDRKRKSRASKKPLPATPTPRPEPPKLSVTSPHVTESPEISVEQRRRENANLGMAAAERSKQNLDWFAVACREYLPNITVATHRQEACRLVAELTQATAA